MGLRYFEKNDGTWFVEIPENHYRLLILYPCRNRDYT